MKITQDRERLAQYCLKNIAYLLAFLLAIYPHLCPAQTTEFPNRFDGCAHTFNLNPGNSYLNSPDYPNTYPIGTACMYKFLAPLDYQIRINCTIDLDKAPNACSTEKFYVDREGFTNHEESEYYCGYGNLMRDSLYRSITLAYTSDGSRGTFGNFRCELNVFPQPCDCGWSKLTKIVNGQETAINEFPSMVALLDDSGTLFCSASILAHNYCITAAHCVQRRNAGDILAVMGDHDLAEASESKYTITHEISDIIVHPDYHPSPVNNDIALLKTITNIEWSRGVGPICLPFNVNPNYDFDGHRADVPGWGTTSFAGPTSDVLQKVTLSIINNTQCARIYQGTAPIYSTQLCTFDDTNTGKDSCQFDSGGQVTLRRRRQFILGCISFGKACGGPQATGVNTRITSYLSWIRQQIDQAMCVMDL